MRENSEIRRFAREVLAGKWGNTVIAFLIYLGITFFLSSIPAVGQVIFLIIIGPLAFGLTLYFLTLVRKGESDFNYIFKAFNFSGKDLGLFGRTLGVYLLAELYILLWTLLLIVPGIIASYSYSMILFIYVDNPEMGISETLRKSKEMMYGYKTKLFLLHLSFIGWGLLCILSFGIGFLWLGPYMFTSLSVFYEELKKAHGIELVSDKKEKDVKEEKKEELKVGGVVDDSEGL
ncbi:MAG: DUF975 family protein [Candidatus Cloacimonetes bacterium]|nr:DUF975 family protein [Candidatus Cloacimonadota bacterium]